MPKGAAMAMADFHARAPAMLAVMPVRKTEVDTTTVFLSLHFIQFVRLWFA